MPTPTLNPSPPPPTTPSNTPSPNPSRTDPPSNSPSRWHLHLQALILRLLTRLGFYLHTIPTPTPPSPTFHQHITTSALNDSNPTSLSLSFYVPASYHETQLSKRYPVVVNFHGGGFTTGLPTDDARWAGTIIHELSAVVVSVGYRLAPEYPFPTAVEDGVCALLYLSANAERLGIDARRICLSGFSAGGNLAFTVPLRLQTYLRSLAETRTRDIPPLPHIISIISFYPSLDNRLSRHQRRASSLAPSRTLPSLLTNLFDSSYFPVHESVTSPYASPAAASDEALMTALPDDIILYLCEWDMLLREGKEFRERLEGLGKRVRCEVIGERRHGFDKSPWPFGLDWKVEVCYRRACGWLREVLEESG